MAGADLTVTQGRPLAMQETSEQAVYLQGALNRSSSVALVLSVGQVASCFEKEVWLGALSNANGPLRTVPKTKRGDSEIMNQGLIWKTAPQLQAPQAPEPPETVVPYRFPAASIIRAPIGPAPSVGGP